jgi:hypothetical protein
VTPVKVSLGRSNVVITLAVLAFLCWIVWAGAHGGWTATETSARVIGYGVALLFAVPLVMLLFALPRFLSPRAVTVDAHGIAISHGRERVAMAWTDLHAVGIGYERIQGEVQKLPTSADEVKEAIKEYVVDEASEALHISAKRRIVLELYPVRPDAPARFPRLKPYWKRLPPPAAGLSDWAWRFPLPPVMSIARQIDDAIRLFAPRHRIGWFPRQPAAKG